jgi:glycosyltransferase involved in cell wall biosynthesis
MNRIKIAYLIDTIQLDTAGTEKQLIELINRLDKACFETHLICLKNSAWINQNELPCEVSVLHYNGLLKLSFAMVIKRFLRLLDHKRFDIVQTFFEDSIFVGYLGKLLTPIPPVLLSSRRDMGLGGEEPWYHALYGKVLPFINRGFDAIVTNGGAIKEYVTKRERIPLSKVKVINNGVTIPVHMEAKPPIFKEIKSDLWMGIVANLKPVKRIDVFLKAFAHLKRVCNSINIHAVILGEGLERAKLVALVGELNLSSSVHFMGSVKNVTAYLQNLDIAVLCSDKEGFPNAILEYMACGLPVIATDVGGNPELVDHTNGFCFPPNDPESLGEALVKLAFSPALRKKMGANSLEKVREKYTWDKIIKEWEEYYRSLIQKT